MGAGGLAEFAIDSIEQLADKASIMTLGDNSRSERSPSKRSM